MRYVKWEEPWYGNPSDPEYKFVNVEYRMEVGDAIRFMKDLVIARNKEENKDIKFKDDNDALEEFLVSFHAYIIEEKEKHVFLESNPMRIKLADSEEFYECSCGCSIFYRYSNGKYTCARMCGIWYEGF